MILCELVGFVYRHEGYSNVRPHFQNPLTLALLSPRNIKRLLKVGNVEQERAIRGIYMTDC